MIKNYQASAYTVLLDDIIHVLVTSTGKAYQDRSMGHFFGKLDGVGYGMGALYGRDDALES